MLRRRRYPQRKLLEKQKEGKKKMKETLGNRSPEIPGCTEGDRGRG
jgi:translation elongation factor EF-4